MTTKLAFLDGLSSQKHLRSLNLGRLRSQESGVYDERILEAYRKNYSLEECSLQLTNEKHQSEVAAILRLNKAGRRYLVEDGPSSRAKGVAVLDAVNDDLDCLFVHLKENPSLCDIHAPDQHAVGDRKRKRS